MILWINFSYNYDGIIQVLGKKREQGKKKITLKVLEMMSHNT
jgi:hypothetical protein